MTAASDRAPLPRAVSYVALAMMVVGVIAVAAGTIGVSDPSTGRALASMGVMATGAVLLLVGWRLRKGDRWAYVAAVVVLTLILAGWVVRGIVTRESWFAGQLLGPAVGLWALLRPESRRHFVG
ncbi:MAG: hypothetical protein ACRDVN_00395 [Jiangellaceae bacterium]